MKKERFSFWVLACSLFLCPFLGMAQEATTTDYTGGTELGLAFILFLIAFAMGLWAFRLNFFGKEK